MIERIPVIMSSGATARVSARNPNSLYVHSQGCWLFRNGRSVYAERMPRTFFVMLVAESPGIISPLEACELLWGNRADGGPDNFRNAISVLVMHAKMIGAALGFRIENEFSRGYCAIPFNFARTGENVSGLDAGNSHILAAIGLGRADGERDSSQA
jgi:hypothetical protein